MTNNKFISLIALSRKARKLILGYDKIKSSGKEFKLIIITSDVSERTRRNSKLYISDDGDIIELEISMFEFGKLIGAEKVGVAAVDDEGFAKAILETMKN